MRALLLLVLLACAPALSAQTPTDSGYLAYGPPEQRQPTTMHRFLYTMMAECLGVEDSDEAFNRIQWYVADFILRVEDYRRMGGLWSPGPRRRIYLDRGRWGDAHVVSHELIHELTGGAEEDDPAFARCEIKDWVP